VRWTIPHNVTREEFLKKGQPKLHVLFQAAVGPKGHFIYQHEATKRTDEKKVELGTKNDNDHFQAFLNCQKGGAMLDKKGIRACQLEKFLRGTWREPDHCADGVPKLGTEFSVHVSPCSSEGLTALKTYVMKSESRIAGPWSDKTGVNKTIEVVPEYDGTGWDGKSEFHEDTWHPFQKEVAEFCEQSVIKAGRVTWNYDPVGQTGKSTIAKYCGFKGLAHVLEFADHRDIAHYVSTNPPRRTYYFDFSRNKSAKMSWHDVFTTIEQVANGEIFNSKYHTAKFYFRRPNILVNANTVPNLSVLSIDRWLVYEIVDGKRVQMSHEKVREIHRQHSENEVYWKEMERLRNAAIKRKAKVDFDVQEKKKPKIDQPIDDAASSTFITIEDDLPMVEPDG